jgi:DNA polymerase-1
MKKLYLVDVSSMFFRAFYAVRPLTAPSGLPTNAIYGFTSMIVKLMKEEKPDYLAFCYDLPTPSFRKEVYPEYKAHRSETPPDLIPQIPYIKKLVEALGIPAFELDGFEADDLIGTLAEFGHRHHCQVVIVSGDKDFGQLVRPGVILYDTMKDVRLDVDGVKAKWGIRPDQFIDYLALIGDASDNVPGVEGIGPKTAEKLLNDFQTLDGIYANLESIKSLSLREKLIKGRESAYLSKHLVTIVTDAPLADNLEQLKSGQPKREVLAELLKELNFKTFEKALLNQSVAETPTHDDLGIPLDAGVPAAHTAPLKSHLQELTLSFEELDSKLPQKSQVWAFSNERGHYLVHNNDLFILQNDLKIWGALLTKKKLCYSGFDLKSFWRDLEITDPEIKWDSQLAAYLLKTDQVGTFAETVSEFLLQNLPAFCSPSEEFHFHELLFHKLKTEIEHNQLHQLLHEIELPIAPILLSMEQAGILLDVQKLLAQSDGLADEIRVLERNICSLAGEQFNISSPKQLAHILFEKLNLPVGKKTKTGYSTDNEVLEKLKEAHPVVPYVLDYRELTKLKSTYVDSLPVLIDPSTHRIHTHFNQALTTTGRLSSTQPNLQNIPIRTPRGHAIRQAFIVPEGKSLLSLDYSQIELRILAHLSEDPGLCRAFSEGQDIHAATASEVFEVPLNEVTSEMRRTAKAINFGIAYGQGAYGLAENLGIGRTDAQNIIKRYFTRFNRVQEYMERTIADAKKHGFVVNIFGRKRILRELKSSNAMVRKFGERAAINAPVQSAASDIVKKAMLAVSDLKEAKMLLQVHDELLFECDQSRAATLMPILIERMENVVRLRVPLKVNGGIGSNWDAAH